MVKKNKLQVKVAKNGNSRTLTIPAELNTTNFNQGDLTLVELKGNKLIYTLDESLINTNAKITKPKNKLAPVKTFKEEKSNVTIIGQATTPDERLQALKAKTGHNKLTFETEDNQSRTREEILKDAFDVIKFQKPKQINHIINALEFGLDSGAFMGVLKDEVRDTIKQLEKDL